MKILIDARFLGPEGTGIGRYTGKLIENLQEIDTKNEYFIVLRGANFDLFQPKNSNFKKVLADAKWYTIKEQILLPKVLFSLRPDLVHFPHFNIPIAYTGKFVVTIHDLIKSEFASKAASTRTSFVYWAKHFIYKQVVRRAASQSRKVIVPTNTIADKVTRQLGVTKEKIVVTYEAADEKFFEWGEKKILPAMEKKVLKKYGLKKPYILYVGTSYPYKNLDRLLAALKFLPENVSFVNPSPRSVFKDKLEEKAHSLGVEKRIVLPGFVPDEDLAVLYLAAECFVLPSLSEGFGLTALEAMASKLPVVCSDIPVLREVCGEEAYYFDPLDERDIAEKINVVLTDKKLKEDLVQRGYERAKQFSWRKMAAQTLKVYEEVGSQ